MLMHRTQRQRRDTYQPGAKPQDRAQKKEEG
jgi:hypothetical protein